MKSKKLEPLEFDQEAKIDFLFLNILNRQYLKNL